MMTIFRHMRAAIAILSAGGSLLGCLSVHDLTPPGGADASTADAAAASDDATTNGSDVATGADGGTGQPCVSGATGCSCPAASTSCSGTCANLQTDPKNCGACGNDCTTKPHVMGPAGVTCNAGACSAQPASCAPGFAHCTANPADICETDLSQMTNCGKCGNACAATTPLCVKAASGGYSCGSGCMAPAMTVCAGTCTDSDTDAKNCGGCGTVCPALTCSNGKLTAASTCSGGKCTAPMPTDCGGFACNAAGTACLTSCTAANQGTNCPSTAPFCIAQKCVPNQLANGSRCSGNSDCMMGNCVSGVCCNEACKGQCDSCSTGTCGSSTGKSCTPTAPNAVGQCDANRNCAVRSCVPGYTNACASSPGACVKWGPTSCGQNCDDCTAARANAPTGGNCNNSGKCVLACAANYADCDGFLADGCEVDITSYGNCGACGHSCATCAQQNAPSWCSSACINFPPPSMACYCRFPGASVACAVD